MTDNTLLPLSIRDVAPTADAQRLTGVRPDGLPDGVHTGGAWLVGDEVWKPLDGRPYLNCDGHIPTLEAVCLELMADRPGFPRNWRIETKNGRTFLVRPWVATIPAEVPYALLTTENLLYIESAVRALNAAGWQINDELSLGIDPESYKPFILDLSNAGYIGPGDRGCYSADEEWRVLKFFETAGAELLVKLRNNARHCITTVEWLLEHPNLKHVYGSFNRPMDGFWAAIPVARAFIQNLYPNWTEGQPHTWIVTEEPLPQSVIERYELRWGWSPIHTKPVEVSNER